MDIKIPFLGDGIDAANVVAILVKPGDAVDVDQTLLELETDKATAPVPSLFEGVVDSIQVNEGDLVKEGMVVLTLNGSNGQKNSNDEKKTESSPAPLESTPKPVVSSPLPVKVQSNQLNYEPNGDMSNIYSSPSILKFAHLSGLDLTRIQGTGHSGRITWDDVKQYVAFLQSRTFSNNSENVGQDENIAKPKKPPVDFSKFGPIEVKKLSSLRQKISTHLANAWSEIPHVTQFADIEIDNVMALRKDLNKKLKKNDVKLSVTVFILKAVAETLKLYENFNSSLDNNELIIKQYIHLGVAVDTDAGLVVPVIKDVDKKSLQEIAVDLDRLANKAREKSLALEDIQGATFTLSNLGGLGASHFTPIVNSPEVAILGTGRATSIVTYDDKTKKITNRLKMPVALSYDHRVIDGADGARFVQSLTSHIENFDKKWVK